MPGEFLILVPDEAPPRKDLGALWGVLRAGGWSQVPSGLAWAQVWVRGPRAPPVAVRGDTLVVGQAFLRRGPAAGDAGAGPGFAARLAREVWGAYVALAREAGREWLFRDPSGGREALAWRLPGLQVAVSTIEAAPAALQPRGELDWDTVADFVLRPASLAARSGLRSVWAPAAGEALDMTTGERMAVWRPLDAALRDTPAHCGQTLRTAVLEALDAWTGAFERPVVEVSGGFDSALVATGARRSTCGGRVAAALNYHGDRLEGDERAWARCVADAAGLPLIERPKPLRPLGEADFAETALGARPSLAALDPERDRDSARELARLGADVVLTGYGGDAVFFQMTSCLPVADYLQGRPSRAAFDPAPLAAARWLRRSLWSVLAACRRPRLELDRASYLDGFFGPRTRALRPEGPAHPWLAGVEAAPPGERLQLLHLTVSQLAYGCSRRGAVAQVVHPLMSQPVLEAGLAIPSWRHVEGGRDRALARAVFADMLPAEVVTRRSKGILTSFYARQASASLGFLRSWLLDGLLASEGVLDRDAMEAALHPDRLIWKGDGLALLNAAAVEAWVRRWS